MPDEAGTFMQMAANRPYRAQGLYKITLRVAPRWRVHTGSTSAIGAIIGLSVV